MKRLILSLTSALIVVTALAGSAGAQARDPSLRYASEMIDAGKVHVRFKVKVFGVLSVMGHFNRLYGEIVSNTDGGTTGVRVKIDASSVSTEDEWRDDFLRGPRFFATDRYPQITFTGACLGRGENGAMQLAGNLSLRGRSRPVVFEFESIGAKPDNSADIYQARTVIRRSEFGLNAMEHLISDEVEITVAMQAASVD
jgi:polyisoprenoid-binding protein YceI